MKALIFITFALCLTIVFFHSVGWVGLHYNTSALLAFAFFGGLLAACAMVLLYNYIFNPND